MASRKRNKRIKTKLYPGFKYSITRSGTPTHGVSDRVKQYLRGIQLDRLNILLTLLYVYS